MSSPLTASVPGSKSLSHRALILAALAPGNSVLHNVQESSDIEATRRLLEQLGASIRQHAPGLYQVSGIVGEGAAGAAKKTGLIDCDVRDSGSTARFFLALLAGSPGDFYLHGTPRMHERPVEPLVNALRTLGASIEYQDKKGFLPLIVHGRRLHGGSATIEISESSQYLSALLLCAPLCAHDLFLSISGETIRSWPYVQTSLAVLEDFALPCIAERQSLGSWAAVDWRCIDAAHASGVRLHVPPLPCQPRDYTVEADWSGATPFLSAGILGDRAVRIEGLNPTSMQADRVFIEIVREMGADFDAASGLASPHRPLRAVRRDMGQCPDLVPCIAVLAACASGESVLYNIGHLRHKECDRLAAIADILHRMGITVQERDDFLTITGGKISISGDDCFQTRHDHRIAMMIVLLHYAAGKNAVHMDDLACVRKSFPDFWENWQKLCPGVLFV